MWKVMLLAFTLLLAMTLLNGVQAQMPSLKVTVDDIRDISSSPLIIETLPKDGKLEKA